MISREDLNPQYIIIGTAVLILGLILVIILLSESFYSEYQSLRKLKSNSTDSTLLQIQIEQITKQNEQLQIWLDEQGGESLSASFPDLVLAVAKRSGIQNISKLRSTGTDGLDEYSVIYQVSFSGSYSRVMRLINKLELASIPLRITHLEMESIAGNQVSCDLKVGILKTASPEELGS